MRGSGWTLSILSHKYDGSCTAGDKASQPVQRWRRYWCAPSATHAATNARCQPGASSGHWDAFAARPSRMGQVRWKMRSLAISLCWTAAIIRNGTLSMIGFALIYRLVIGGPDRSFFKAPAWYKLLSLGRIVDGVFSQALSRISSSFFQSASTKRNPVCSR